MSELSPAELDYVWELAKADVYEKFALAGHMIIESSNPYEENQVEFDIYEAAFEHYLMSLLGY